MPGGMEGDIAAKFLAAVLAQPKVNKLLSSDHVSVDGTLIEAWASIKSSKPKDGSGDGARRRAQCRSGLPWPETPIRFIVVVPIAAKITPARFGARAPIHIGRAVRTRRHRN
jgi:hypothetical protein